MAESQYFQIPAFKYTHNPFEMGKIGGIAFMFHVIPDRDDASTFITRVIFSISLLAAVGRQFVAGSGPFILPEEQKAGSNYFRYSFYRLKNQLEDSNLTNRNDILITHTDATQLQKASVKQCDFLASSGGNLYCCADANNPIETSTYICERCTLPEPVRRCDNLRIQKIVGSKDSQGKYQITPEYYCINGNSIPSDTEPCVGFSGSEPDCWIPFKFYLQPPPKPHIGFRTQSS
ncbi:hypothetical protein ACFLV4_05810 [Chloroflexota bacterium]